MGDWIVKYGGLLEVLVSVLAVVAGFTGDLARSTHFFVLALFMRTVRKDLERALTPSLDTRGTR